VLLGLVLLAVGFAWFAESVGWIDAAWRASAWPVILIVVGSWLVYLRIRHGRHAWHRAWPRW
jgi:hypothetical protein